MGVTPGPAADVEHPLARPQAEREQVGPVVIEIMRHAAELDVPLEVNVAWGTTWADAKT